MARAYTVKAIALIFQDEWFSMEDNSPARLTVEPDYSSLQGDLPIQLFMLQAHRGSHPIVHHVLRTVHILILCLYL